MTSENSSSVTAIDPTSPASFAEEETATTVPPQSTTEGPPKATDDTSVASVASAAPASTDGNRVRRPDLLFEPDVAAIRVAVRDVSVSLKPEWFLMTCWPGGSRSFQKFEASLNMPNGDIIWFDPIPPPPTTNDLRYEWTDTGRNGFLKGYTPNSAELFRSIRDAIGDFVVFPEDDDETRSFLALWVMESYAFPNATSVPYLAIGGPKGSGKTRLLDVFERLAFNPIRASNASPAVIFRELNNRRGTLLYDEAENLTRNPDMLAIMNAGYRSGGIVKRAEKVGDTFQPTAFDVFGPKVLAAIAPLADTLESRCIRLLMMKPETEIAAATRRLDEDPSRWTKLRDGLYAWVLSHAFQLRKIALDSSIGTGFINRDRELVEPLLGIAQIVEDSGEPGLDGLVRPFLAKLMSGSGDDRANEADQILIETLFDLVREGKHDIQPQGLLTHVKFAAPELFRSWTARNVGRALRQLGVQEPDRGGGKRSYKHVSKDHLRQVAKKNGLRLPDDPN